MSSEHRELVIETLACAEAELIDRVVDLMIERDSYRLLAKQAIHALHDLQVRARQHHVRYQRLDRALRERVLHEQQEVA